MSSLAPLGSPRAPEAGSGWISCPSCRLTSSWICRGLAIVFFGWLLAVVGGNGEMASVEKWLWGESLEWAGASNPKWEESCHRYAHFLGCTSKGDFSLIWSRDRLSSFLCLIMLTVVICSKLLSLRFTELTLDRLFRLMLFDSRSSCVC